MDTTQQTQELLSQIETAIAALTAIREVGRQFPADNYNPISATTQKYITVVIQNLSSERYDIANGIVSCTMGNVVESGIDRLAVAAARRDDVSQFIDN